MKGTSTSGPHTEGAFTRAVLARRCAAPLRSAPLLRSLARKARSGTGAVSRQA